jgi:OB-fold nucleic acid binding domain
MTPRPAFQGPVVAVATTMLLSVLSFQRPLSVRAFSVCGRQSLTQQALHHRPQRTSFLLFCTSTQLDELNEKIKIKGDEIRKLKEDGVDKTALGPHIDELVALKAQLPPKGTEKPKQKLVTEEETPAVAMMKNAVEEMSESDYRLNRLAKVDAMRDAGVEPFEYTYTTTHSAAALASLYEGKLQVGEEDGDATVAVAGRIMTRRVFGKLAFFTLQDESGEIQLQFDKSRLWDSFKVCFFAVSFLVLTFQVSEIIPSSHEIVDSFCTANFCSNSKIGPMEAT